MWKISNYFRDIKTKRKIAKETKVREEKEYRELHPYLKPRDYVIGWKAITGWNSEMSGFNATQIEEVQGTVEDYRDEENGGCVKISNKWYILGWGLNQLVIEKIIKT
jgi:hypothetical protein